MQTESPVAAELGRIAQVIADREKRKPSLASIARHMGLSREYIHKMAQGSQAVSPKQCLRFHDLWGSDVRLLRPDIEWKFEKGRPVAYLVRVEA
jgi:DNA-binding transcriptional regulator YdaS (Cro superfamily)